jgi:hypothetical protein
MIWFVLKQVDDVPIKSLVVKITIVALPLIDHAEHETGLMQQ